MAIITPAGLSDLESLKRFVNAAASIARCDGGILIGGAPGEWAIIVQHRIPKKTELSHKDEIWLRKAMSYGDVLNLKEIPPPWDAAPKILKSIDIDHVICVSVKDSIGSLLGVVVLTSDDPNTGLSTDKIHALQAHSLRMRHAVGHRSITASSIRLGALQRLRLLESAVIHAKDAILITEAQPISQPGPRIIYCNTAFLATTGFMTEDVVGKTPRILQCDETCRATLKIVRQSLAQWKPVQVELVNKRKDGTRFWVQLSIVPVADESGFFTHWVSIQRDITERKDAEVAYQQAQIDRERQLALESRLAERENMQEQLSYAAYHDDLTRLKNKAYLMEALKQIFNHAEAVGASILYLDLDKFKYVNDGMGHHAGDALLRTVARQLQNCIDESACLARIGGDEFAILHTGEAHRENALSTAERAIRVLDVAFEIEGQSIFTSCSIGVATRDSSHTDAEDLIRDADVAMYAAKKKGRGRWALFDSSMRQAAIDTLLMRNAIKHALERGEFYLVYQPIYALKSLEITGVEALLRWRNPELGDISPDIFIEVAEEVGIICELGHWVMGMACREVQGWNRSSEHQLTLSINASSTELKETSFVSNVANILEKARFDPHNLQLEITESVFLNESEKVALALAELRGLGIRIALDDFGTGYSSLGYIDRYPIDAIKIDRSFINRMMTHPRTAAVIKSIFSLGSALGAAIVAEGIETHEQLDQLRRLKCPYVQGYLLNPPLSSQAFKDLLAHHALAYRF
ncbi:EAL domain-containing protein [Pseudomonas graminis]|uniref:putative bifunctional diguanylate cyclase/phosphodiesterase n=1 Tax=Pseudomonas graminis TaxID=158627 RepID=UPI00234B4DAE|nr:EAL domain-containing protein [Pseudomonas graminis]MDC6378928.1 EAL domain-containing protein [Pseudomonas graminis]